MSTATLSSKGQITIPVAVRAALGLSTGDKVEFIQTEDGHFELIAATLPISALKGILGKPKKSLTIEEMNDVIAAAGASAGAK